MSLCVCIQSVDCVFVVTQAVHYCLSRKEKEAIKNSLQQYKQIQPTQHTTYYGEQCVQDTNTLSLPLSLLLSLPCPVVVHSTDRLAGSLQQWMTT